MVDFGEDYNFSQGLFVDDNGFIGEQNSQEMFGDMTNFLFDSSQPSLGLLESDMISTTTVGTSQDQVQPGIPPVVSSPQAEELSLGENGLGLSASFLQQIANVDDSDGSVKLEVISTLNLFSNTANYAVPLSNAEDDKGFSAVAGPSGTICNNGFGIAYDDDLRSRDLIPQEEVVLLDNWRGLYNFKVIPFLDANENASKKVVYSEEQNKLFCNTSTAVKFKFEMAYDKIKNIDQFMVRAFLTFVDNDAINKPVLRCLACTEAETKITDESMKYRLVHMLRPCDAKSETDYFQHEVSKRCYVILPLKYPEPGMTYATKSFCFTCRNSCSRLSIDGKARRAIAVLFSLVDKASGTVVGRSHTYVRICSAPVRDYKKEQSSAATGGVSRKRKSAETEQDLPPLPPPKLANFGTAEIPMNQMNNFETAEIPMNQMNEVQPTTISFLMREQTIRSVVRASAAGRCEEDGVSSSQETVYSCDESEHKITLRSLVHDLRWVLKLKHNDDSVLRGYSNNVFSTLKLLQDLCNSARRYESLQAPDNEQSPDGGVHDVDTY